MQPIPQLAEIADQFDAIVFDQWGVLHDGSKAYPHAVTAVHNAYKGGQRLAVLSNSGKRADINLDRIAGKGFERDAFAQVMTSGEALWRDLADGALARIGAVYPITAARGDAEAWRGDLDLRFVDDVTDADAMLLMGLPDDGTPPEVTAALKVALQAGTQMLCSNPDRASPRADGVVVPSPGALAHQYADDGGDVVFYGKPHRPVFDALARALGLSDPSRILMVGDSPEHDIAGARNAGWKSLFVKGGLHAAHEGDPADLFDAHARPDFIINLLR